MTYKKLLKQLRKTLDIYQQAYDENWSNDILEKRDMHDGLCNRWLWHNFDLFLFMGNEKIELTRIVLNAFPGGGGYIGGKPVGDGRIYLMKRVIFLRVLIDEIERNMK
jgi:hypothetical protein